MINSINKLDKNGFTLLELAIVIIILGVLMSGGLMAYKSYLQAKTLSELNERIQVSQDALTDFVMDNKCQVPEDDDLVDYFGLSSTDDLEAYHTRMWCQIEQPNTINESSSWVDTGSIYGSQGDVITVSGSAAQAWQFFPADVSLYGGGGSALTAYENGSNSTGTDYIGNHLADAVRFPCPAPFQSVSSSGFGREAYDMTATNAQGGTGTCDTSVSGIITATGADGETIFIGTLPTATLGLGAKYAIDPYGNLLTYAVSESMVAMGALEGGLRNNGAITIVDDIIEGNSITSNARFALISHGKEGNGAFPAFGSDFNTCDTDRLDSVNCPDWDSVSSRSVSFGGGSSDSFSTVTFLSSARWAFSSTLSYSNTVVSSLDYGEDGWLRQTDAEGSNVQTKNVGNFGIGVTPSSEARLHVDGHYGDGAASGNAGVVAITGDGDSDLDAYSVLLLGDDEKVDPMSSGWALTNAYDSSGTSESDFQISYSEGSPFLTIDSETGFVGIGTEDPSASLHVNDDDGQGNILVTGASDNGQTYSILYLGAGPTTTSVVDSWVFAHKNQTGTSYAGDLQIGRWLNNSLRIDLAIDSSTGYVGVGTTTPAVKLDVSGGVKVGNQSLVSTCNSSTVGTLRYNTSEQSLQVCTGSEWKSTGGADNCTVCIQCFARTGGSSTGGSNGSQCVSVDGGWSGLAWYPCPTNQTDDQASVCRIQMYCN